MKRATKIALAVATTLSLGLAAAVVSAGPAPWGHGGPWGGNADGCGMGPAMMGGPGAVRGERQRGGGPVNAEARLAALKVKLGITAQQDAAWQAFVNHAKQQQEKRQAAMTKLQESRADGSKSLPELMAQRSEFMTHQVAEMEANTTALKDLYAVLTAEQKAIADRSLGGRRQGQNHAGHRG